MNSVKVYSNNTNTFSNRRENKTMPTFGTDTYEVSNPKNKKDKNAKRKRNLIIFGTLITTAAVAVGALYFNGKKVKKTNITENIPEVKDNILSKFKKDLGNSSISPETLKKNIVDMNNLLKSENLNEESFGNIVECMARHYEKLISSTCPDKEKITFYEEYYNFLNLYFENISISNKLQEILVQKSKLELKETNIDEDSKLLQNVLQDGKNDFLYKRILILSLFKKYKDNKDDIAKLADIINKNTDLNKFNQNKAKYQKQLALLLNTYNASEDTIKNNSSTIINCIMTPGLQFSYPQDSYYYYNDIEPKTFFNKSEDSDVSSTFASLITDLLEQLGVSNTSILTEAINNTNNPNIKAVSLDDGNNKLNCLRFKVDENNYIYYNIDIYNNSITRLNFDIESTNDNVNSFNYQGHAVKKKDIPVLFEKEFDKK